MQKTYEVACQEHRLDQEEEYQMVEEVIGLVSQNMLALALWWTYRIGKGQNVGIRGTHPEIRREVDKRPEEPLRD